MERRMRLHLTSLISSQGSITQTGLIVVCGIIDKAFNIFQVGLMK